MKRFLITEEDKKHIRNLYRLNELDANKLLPDLIDLVKKMEKDGEFDDSDSLSRINSDDIKHDKLSSDTLYSPLINVKPPKGDYGRVRPGLDTISKPHPGVDMAVPSGTKVFSPADGVVKDAKIRKNACGGTLYIDHKNGYKSRYCHLRQINVKKGDTVKQGEVVALTGGNSYDIGHGNSSGAHLHFELYHNNKLVDPASVVEKTFPNDPS